MIQLEAHPRGVLLPVRAKAGARRNGVFGEHDGALRVDVAAPPEKGKANRAIAQVLAEWFGTSKSAVELVSGATSSCKRFLIVGISAIEAGRRIEAGDQAAKHNGCR
ncbi:MAG: DUF167 domain-containing protein [Planctomycetota bacterium]|nr:MAG: DUF167 domain-containing protein [Planctomycetota bacterium]